MPTVESPDFYVSRQGTSPSYKEYLAVANLLFLIWCTSVAFPFIQTVFVLVVLSVL